MRAQESLATKFILNPLKGGIVGYFVFVILLITTKYISYLVGNQLSFQIETEDFTFSLVGFFLFFILKLLENFKERRAN